MVDPVVCDDGFSYERTALEGWLLDHDTSFMSGDPLSNKCIVPNRSLKSRLMETSLG